MAATHEGITTGARRAVGIAILCGLVLAGAPALAAGQDLARMEQAVRARADQGTFMGAVLVARGDQVLFSKGFGSANLEWDIPNTPTTKFRLGSITKQFTAVSILLLEERGRLKLTDRVGQHLKDAPAGWSDITIFHLLTHTSGIPNFTALPEFRTWKLSPTPIAQAVGYIRDRPLDFSPGERMSYSNSGYMVLGLLIEQITGGTYEAFLRENVFAPLGMSDSGYDSRAILQNRAAGYSSGPGGIANATHIDMTIPHAAGALYSTTEDLLRWTRGLFGGKLLSPSSLAKLTTPHKNNYALGVTVNAVNGRTVVQHGGGIDGFNTHLAYYPAEQLTVVVLSNLNGPAPGPLATQLGAVANGEPIVLASERPDLPLPADRLARLAGTYEVTPTVSLTVTVNGDRLLAQLGAGPPEPLLAASASRFYARRPDAEITFEEDASGAITGLVIEQGGQPQRARRVDVR